MAAATLQRNLRGWDGVAPLVPFGCESKTSTKHHQKPFRSNMEHGPQQLMIRLATLLLGGKPIEVVLSGFMGPNDRAFRLARASEDRSAKARGTGGGWVGYRGRLKPVSMSRGSSLVGRSNTA